jgi:hypothetical protein
MNVAYYTQHLRDYLWVEPIWELTGGTFCSELREAPALFAENAPEAPFRALQTRRRWTIGRAIGNRRLRLKNKASRLMLAQVARELRPDVIVTTSNHRHAIRRDFWGSLSQGFSTFPRVKQVQAFHGVSSKNVKFNPWMAEYDLLLLPGKRERDKFAALGVLDKVQHALIGHPKADRVLRGELTVAKARALYGLPDRPTILYAPTHGALSSFFAWGLEICRAVPPGCNLIVKPHPSLITTINAETAGRETIAAVQEYLQQRGGLWLPLEPDVMLPMAAADVLVTDYSSVAEEFLVFDRPLIFADHLATATGRDRAQRDKGDWDELFASGLRLTESGEVRAALERSLKRPQEYTSQRHKLRDFVFENLDGHSAARAAAAIRALC